MRHLELKIPPLFLVIIFAILMWLSHLYLPQFIFNDTLRFSLLAIFLILGITIVLLGVWTFKQAQTTINPTKPDTSSSLVNIGIYKVTRNPMYVGMASALIGWACWLNSLWSLAFVVVFILYITYFQIKPEERVLSQLFKQEYIDYCAKVNRWL